MAKARAGWRVPIVGQDIVWGEGVNLLPDLCRTGQVSSQPQREPMTERYYWAFGGLVLALATIGASIFLSRTQRSSGKSATFVDILLFWPLILRGERSQREKVFIIGGFLIAAALIASSFLLPH